MRRLKPLLIRTSPFAGFRNNLLGHAATLLTEHHTFPTPSLCCHERLMARNVGMRCHTTARPQWQCCTVTGWSMCTGTARALAVRFQRRAASPPIGGAAVGAECHELVAEDAVDSDAMLAALLQREERAGSVDESADEGARGGAAMRTTPHESGERIRGDREARGMRDRDRTRQRERSGRQRRRDKHRDAGMSSDDGGEHRGADGRGRSGGGEKVACERKRSGRGDAGSDSGDSDREDRKKRRRSHKSHKGKGKHRSKDRRHKAEHRSGPRGSVELQEAIEYLIGEGVDVSQIVKGARGYHVWNAMPCPDVCVSSATRAARMLTTVPAVHLSTDIRPTQTKTR